MKRITLGLVLLGILILGLVAEPALSLPQGQVLWAAPGQNPARQTVPTRTPTLPPPTETRSVPPTSKPPANPPTPVPTATVGVTPAGQVSEPLLPEAGGLSPHLSLEVTMIVGGIVTLLLATARRRV